MIWLLIATTLTFPPRAQANPVVLLERQLNATLRDKILTFRTFSKNSSQHYDEDGQARKQGDVGPWTIYSQVLVKKVELSQSRLRLTGVRVIHHYDKNEKKLIASRSDMQVEIDLDVKSMPTAQAISATMAKVFAPPGGLLPLVPSYWRSYLGAKKEEKSSDSDVQTIRTGGVVQGAKLIKQVPPKYAEIAKSFLLEGLVVLEAEINESGDIDNLTIVQPAGAGFDESAIEAVSQWKYTPTLLNGKPVRVVTTITVNYQFSR